jgi:signal transduction histidine kinase
LPVAICIAILRYRLYDIDIIINRTLVYGASSLLVAAAYVFTALVLGAIIGTRHSAWVTAGATLAAVGVFRPLRRRIQDAVDRRFRKARYEALARVASFLDELRAGRTAPDGLGPLLRDVLSLPDLQLYYAWPDEAGGHIDDQGVYVTLDRADGRTYSAVERAGIPLAVVAYSAIVTQSSPTGQHAPIDEVLDRAGLAIEIARLQAEVRHQLAEVEASRARIVAAGYAERRRLERDLHDGAQQRLVSIGLALRHAQHELGPSHVSQTIEEAVSQIGAAIADLRELANGVRPANLDNGLGFALRELARRTPVPMEVCADDERFPSDVEATAYFVACEAVTNAVKHATAGRLLVQTERIDGHLVVTIRDDGVGGAQPVNGSGLRGLSDRVTAVGGRMQLESPAGIGTRLIAELPCAS